jgi:hypothetical protein
VLGGGEEAFFEGDGEGVEGGLRAVHPALAALAGGVQAADDQVEAFERGLLVGEVAAVLDDLAELVVQRLDRVGIRYETWDARAAPAAGFSRRYGATVRDRGVGGIS